MARLLGAVLLSLGGLYLARTMQVDVFPDLSAPTVAVLTESHGLDAEEVEKLVTFRWKRLLTEPPVCAASAPPPPQASPLSG